MSNYSEITVPVSFNELDAAERFAAKAGLGFQVRVKRTLLTRSATVTFTNSEPTSRLKVTAMRVLAEMYGI